jgi:DNA-binding CsgD family transcriptional regulator
LAILTPRERDVLLEIARGLTNAEIATTLYAPTHLRTYAPTHLRTYAPTHLRNRVAAVILAYELGLVD